MLGSGPPEVREEREGEDVLEGMQVAVEEVAVARRDFAVVKTGEPGLSGRLWCRVAVFRGPASSPGVAGEKRGEAVTDTREPTLGAVPTLGASSRLGSRSTLVSDPPELLMSMLMMLGCEVGTEDNFLGGKGNLVLSGAGMVRLPESWEIYHWSFHS